MDDDQEQYIQELIAEKQQQKIQEEKLRLQISSLAQQHQKTQQENQAISALLRQQRESFFSGIVAKQSSTGLLNHKRFLVLANGFLAYYSKAPPGFSGEKDGLGLQNEVSKSCVETSRILQCDPMKPNKFVVEFNSTDKNYKKVVGGSGLTMSLGPGAAAAASVGGTQQSRGMAVSQQQKDSKTIKWIFSCESAVIRDQWVTAINLGKQAPMRMQEIEDQLRRKQDEEEKLRQQIDKSKEQQSEMRLQQERRRIEKQEEMLRLEAERKNRQMMEERERMEKEQAEMQEKELMARSALDEQEEELRRRLEEEAAAQADREMNEAKALAEQRQAMEELRAKEAEIQALIARKEEEERMEREKEQQRRHREHVLEQMHDEWQYKYLQAFEVNTNPDEDEMNADAAAATVISAKLTGNSIEINEDMIMKGKFLYSVVSGFKQKAMSVARMLVEDQLANTKNFITSESAAAFFSGDVSTNDDTQTFVVDNIAFKLALSTMKSARIPQLQQTQECLVYSEEAIKQLTHEFKSINALNNAIIAEMKVNPDFSLRVPLSCLIEFKGIVVLAIAIPAMEEEELSLLKGLDNMGAFVDKTAGNMRLQTDLITLGARLKLKPHGNTELSSSVQIHRIAKSEYEVMRECENADLLDSFAPKNLDVYMLLRCANLFPLDISLDNERIYYQQKLRREFIRTMTTQINSDGFIDEHTLEVDELQLTEAATMLRTVAIRKLIDRLESLDLLPLDSVALKEAFHQAGVNMRYLGVVAKHAVLAHVKEICCVEIAARVCKKILRNNIVESMRKFHEGISRDTNESRWNNDVQLFQQQPQHQQTQQQVSIRTFESAGSVSAERHLQVNLLDFLNLLLGSGNETEFFWESIIYRQALFDFNYGVKQNEIVKGAFVHAVKLHCSIDFEVTESTGIFEQLNPFLSSQIIGFLPPKCEIFDFKELQVNEAANKYAELMEDGDHVAALPALNLKLAVLSWSKAAQQQQQQLQSLSSQQYSPQQEEDLSLYRLEEVKLLSDLSELLFSFNNYEESTAKAVQALDLSPIAHVCQVKSLGSILKAKLMRGDNQRAMECFDRAVSIIEFHLGVLHPLHSILYSILGHFYSQKKYNEEAIALYKSSLSNSIKALGETHVHTAEVFKDIGSLYMKMGQLSDSFSHFESAYSILMNDPKHSSSVAFAQTTSLLATLCLTQGKFEESQFFISKSIEIFTEQGTKCLKDLIDAYLVLCRVQEMAGFKQKCVMNADRAWLKSKELSEEVVVQSAQESLVKIVFQISVSSLSRVDAAELTAISSHIQSVLDEERRTTRKSLTASNQMALQYFLHATAISSLGSFMQMVIDSLLDNAHYLNQVEFFNNYRQHLKSLGEQSQLHAAILSYENLLLILTSSFAIEMLKRN